MDEEWVNPEGDGIIYLTFNKYGVCEFTQEAAHMLLERAGFVQREGK